MRGTAAQLRYQPNDWGALSAFLAMETAFWLVRDAVQQLLFATAEPTLIHIQRHSSGLQSSLFAG